MHDVIWEALSLAGYVYVRVLDVFSVRVGAGKASVHQPAWQLYSWAVIGRRAVIPSVTIWVAPTGGHRPSESSLTEVLTGRRDA